MDLRKFLDLREMQRMQDLFSDATGLAAIAADANGEYITKGSNFTDFCMKYTRGTEEGARRCKKCDLEGKGTYFCHAGLMDFGADIVVEGEKVGTIVGGQVLPAPPDEAKFRAVARELGVNEDEYIKALSKVPVRSEKMIRSAAALLEMIMNQWVNLNYYQKSNEKKLETFKQESGRISKAVEEIRGSTRELTQSASMEKILAINASIEAGRAGAAGVGFGVVAKEIGAISEKSGAVYDKILKQVEAVESAVENIEKAGV